MPYRPLIDLLRAGNQFRTNPLGRSDYPVRLLTKRTLAQQLVPVASARSRSPCRLQYGWPDHPYRRPPG